MPYKDPHSPAAKASQRRSTERYNRKNRTTILKKKHLRYEAGDRERELARYRKQRASAMLKVSRGQPPKCANCGCDDTRVLDINHKNGLPKGHWRSWKEHGRGLYARILNGEYPVEWFDIRCRLCNILHFLLMKFPDLVSEFTITWHGKNNDD